MNNMSDFIKKMGEVPEQGLHRGTPAQLKEQKEALVKSGNSLVNHMRAYQEVVTGKKQPVVENQETNSGEVTLTESDTTKLIGALTVVKELLDCNLTENTVEIATKVKKIINKI
jgi:Trp operon repressor